MAKVESGKPCGHSGCLSHVTKPCEGCGRINGQGSFETVDREIVGETPVGKKSRLYFGKARKKFYERNK